MEKLSGKLSPVGGLSGQTTIPAYSGTKDYERLKNLPQIEGITLIKNKTFTELGMTECSNQDIINLFK